MAKRRKKKITTHKLREILRLRLENNMGYREIARSCAISHVSVMAWLKPVENLSWDEIKNLEDEKLEKLVKGEKQVGSRDLRPEPDWSVIHKEMSKKGVTLRLLWEEYKEDHPDGYQPTQFYKRYRDWKKTLSPWMRQSHKAGEKMFVDYAGHTVPVQNQKNGEISRAQIFVAVLGMSNYTFAEAVWDQSASSWIESHINAFEFFRGVPRLLIPDNLKAAVHKPDRYDPDISAGYYEMASYYGAAVLPARVRKPKDKAKVEVAVQIVERWILAALRNKTFFTLPELNWDIRSLLHRLNEREFKKLPGTRRSWFESLEKEALLSLPEYRYEVAEWKKARVSMDYHVELNRHYYSVPYRLIHKEVRIRHTRKTVEIFFKSKRVASHMKSFSPGRHTTTSEHMPKGHREHMEWNPSRIMRWAEKAGEATLNVVGGILRSRLYPEQGYRSCLGIMRLGKHYGNDRLEAACRRAVEYDQRRYKYIKNILEKGLDKQVSAEPETRPPVTHDNIRGGKYFE